MNSAVFYSSKTDMWATPQDFFDALDAEFHFTLDACAVKENAKCAAYYTPEQNGLDQPWTGRVWCNPPYGRNVGQWVKKAHDTASGGGDLSLCYCLPALIHAGFTITSMAKRKSGLSKVA